MRSFPKQLAASAVLLGLLAAGAALPATAASPLSAAAAIPRPWATVEITFTGDYAAYSRIYLYNTVASKWQFLNAFKDNTLNADTAGEYLLTTENLRFAEMDWTFFIAGGFVMVGIVVAYIVVKKRYWFW